MSTIQAPELTEARQTAKDVCCPTPTPKNLRDPPRTSVVVLPGFHHRGSQRITEGSLFSLTGSRRGAFAFRRNPSGIKPIPAIELTMR